MLKSYYYYYYYYLFIENAEDFINIVPHTP